MFWRDRPGQNLPFLFPLSNPRPAHLIVARLRQDAGAAGQQVENPEGSEVAPPPKRRRHTVKAKPFGGPSGPGDPGTLDLRHCQMSMRQLSISGDYLQKIVIGSKPVEYRADKPYYRRRLFPGGMRVDQLLLTHGYPAAGAKKVEALFNIKSITPKNKRQAVAEAPAYLLLSPPSSSASSSERRGKGISAHGPPPARAILMPPRPPPPTLLALPHRRQGAVG